MLDPATKTSDSYDGYEARDYGSRARKAAKNYTKYKSWNGSEVRFGAEMNAAEESGICSPPLWTTSPPRSPPQQRPPQNHYRSLSPTSRTQAIARGQRELMEMVRNMPEACYELSLKDLVEKKPPMVEIRQESRVEERDTIPISNEVLFRREDSKKKKKNDKRAQVIRRSKSIDSGGFYLKMVFPVSLGSKKKKKNDSVTNTSAKVSPKPPAPDGSAKGVDKEWWKKRFSVSSESESGRSISNSESMKSSGSGSSSSSSSSRSSIRRRSGGCCWSFIHTKKNQTRSK